MNILSREIPKAKLLSLNLFPILSSTSPDPQHHQIISSAWQPHLKPLNKRLICGYNMWVGLDGIHIRTLLSQDHNHHDGNVCLSRNWRRLPKVSCQISGQAPCKMRHWSCGSIVIFYYDVTLAVWHICICICVAFVFVFVSLLYLYFCHFVLVSLIYLCHFCICFAYVFVFVSLLYLCHFCICIVSCSNGVTLAVWHFCISLLCL